MAVKLNTYLRFDGTAKDAMEFYKTVFGGEVYSDTFGTFKDKSGMPVDDVDLDKVMHAYLKGDNGIELMASDVPSHIEFVDGSRVSQSLSGDDEEVLRGYWDKLKEGGEISAPLTKAPWGDTFGMLTDKFGIEWMVNIGPVQNA